VATTSAGADDDEPELPDRPIEGKVQSPEVAERVLVRRPQIGDTRPAPEVAPVTKSADRQAAAGPHPQAPAAARGGRGQSADAGGRRRGPL
jgi:hypothetical protein